MTSAVLCQCLTHKQAKELLLTKVYVFKSHKMPNTERQFPYRSWSLGRKHHYSKLWILENHLFLQAKVLLGGAMYCKTNLPLYVPSVVRLDLPAPSARYTAMDII